MIGKTLYKAKIVSGNIKMFSYTIVIEQRKYYYFSEKQDPQHACYKTDVGVVIFLTKKEAKYALVKNLRHSVKMGEQYLHKTELQLDEALKLQEI